MKGQCKTRWTFIKLLYKNIYSTEIKWHGLIVEKYAFHWPESPFVYIWNKKTYTGHTVRIKITPNSLLELTWKPVIYNKHLKYFVHIVWYKAIENWMRKKHLFFFFYMSCVFKMYPFFHLETNSMTKACHYQFGHGKQSSIIYLWKALLLLGLLRKYMSASFL